MAAISRISKERYLMPRARKSPPFANKPPKEMTAERLRISLNPVRFQQSSFQDRYEALPPEFQEAVKAKEARVGMDAGIRSFRAGQPNKRCGENRAEGIEVEDGTWQRRAVAPRLSPS